MTDTVKHLDIKATSSLTGLSPSVLRIWELRYGWPNPKRKSNGYRSYAQHQIEELSRVAALVKSGTPISSLIVDGLPRWPSAQAAAPGSRTLIQARAVIAPVNPIEAGLQKELLDALESNRTQTAAHILQRIFWTVRPCDEPQTALAPALIALAELRTHNRPLPDAGKIVSLVRERCDQLMRMQRTAPDALLVVPERAGDEALASLVAVVLCFRGIAAKVWVDMREPTGPCIVVSDGDTMHTRRRQQIGSISTLGTAPTASLADLLDRSKPIAWFATAAR